MQTGRRCTCVELAQAASSWESRNTGSLENESTMGLGGGGKTVPKTCTLRPPSSTLSSLVLLGDSLVVGRSRFRDQDNLLGNPAHHSVAPSLKIFHTRRPCHDIYELRATDLGDEWDNTRQYRKRMQNNATKIRKIAQDVYRALGSGFSEDVYDRAMQVGLRPAKIRYEGQKVVELKYKDHYVGEGYPDLVVRLGRERRVVELKAVGGELGASEEQQLKNYMKILKVERGLLINFQQPGKNSRKTRLEIREVKLA